MLPLKRVLAASILIAAPISLCWAAPPPWAPAHGYRAKHHYIYYPEREIYYAPDSGSWFWLDGGEWRVGVNLPSIYQPYVRTGIQLDLESDRPYLEHHHVVNYYGKGKPYKGGHDRDTKNKSAKHHPGKDKSGKGNGKGESKH